MADSPTIFIDDMVTRIPGNIMDTREFDLNVRSYAGMAPFDAAFGGELFYWFFESQSIVRPRDNPDWLPDPGVLAEVPLLIWINGGPGGSSEFGLFCENGPLRMEADAACTIAANPFTWNQKAHVIYWDQPVGTGYSRSRSGSDYVRTEKELSQQFYLALQFFLNRHPEYRPCRLYITGESYAGKYIPHIATQIMNQNNALASTDSPDFINLAGLAVGDGWMDPRRQLKWVIDYAFNLGFLDTLQVKKMNARWDAFDALCAAGDWPGATDAGNNLNNAVLACGGMPDVYDVRYWSDTSGDNIGAYMNRAGVMKALHVPDTYQWVTADNSGPVSDALKADIMKDATVLFPPLLAEKDASGNPLYRLLFYTGNFDMSACGFTGTENILQDLKSRDGEGWKYQEEWNQLERDVWVTPPSATNGFVKSYANLTQAVIPGAGHLVPMNKPMISREMLYTWLFDYSDYPGYEPLAPFDAKNAD